MHFQRLGEIGRERPAVEADGDLFWLDPVTVDIDGAFWASGGVERTARALVEGSLSRADAAGLRVGAPIAPPSAVMCIGRNYAAHAAESGNVPPEDPMLFFKHPSSIVGPHDSIPFPPGAEQLDWEVELAAVIGAPLYRSESPEEALSAVAGYTVANDVSERFWQKHRGGGQFGKGKSAPGFCPVGPAVVPAHDLHAGSLRLWSAVNGEPRQDGNTADMILSVGELLHDLSHYLRLTPGDLVLTGTPEGVAMGGRFPFLQPGDLLEVGVEGLGSQRTRIVSS